MGTGLPELTPFRVLAEACAIGLLLGIERYKARRPGETGFGSVRTFAAIGMIGGVCGILGKIAFTATAFGAIAILVTIAFFKDSEFKPGLTTEVAALAVFWLGFLVNTNETLALSATIVLALLLASKTTLHDFIKASVSERELFDTLKFLAVILVVYPLLPDEYVGPWEFFNPARVWLMIILVSTVSYAGYLLVRWLGPNRGVLLSALAGGVVSTTATSLSLAGRARAAPVSSPFLGLAGGLANCVQLPKILVLIWAVDRGLALELTPALLAGTLAGAIGLGAMTISFARNRDPAAAIAFANPFSLSPALRFGAMFVTVLFLIKAAAAAFGSRGLWLASSFGGAASATAASLSVANLSEQGLLSAESAGLPVLAALTANALVKLVLALVQGTRAFAWRLGLGLALILGAAWITYAMST